MSRKAFWLLWALVPLVQMLAAIPARGQTPLLSVSSQTTNYTDTTGVVWNPVKQCGTPSTYLMNPVQVITGTQPAAGDQKLYNAETFSGGTMTCTFAVPTPGTYSVLLKFAEIWYGTTAGGPCNPASCAGQRIFNVTINGVVVLSNFDIAATAGGSLKAVDRTFAVNVTQGAITIAFKATATSPDQNAKFDSIQITPTAPANTPPTIVQQPSAQSAFPGATATFSVVANGTAPLSYQWQKNGASISGATSASYTTPPVQSSDSGAQFDVIVSNSIGSVQSANAGLTVSSTPPAVSQMTISGTDPNGNNVSITIDPTKQIRLSGTLVNGFTFSGGSGQPQQITSVSPSQGPSGTTITVTGTGFLPNSTVTLVCPSVTLGGGTNYPAMVTSQTGSTTIVATAPTGPNPGACDVRVDP